MILPTKDLAVDPEHDARGSLMLGYVKSYTIMKCQFTIIF